MNLLAGAVVLVLSMLLGGCALRTTEASVPSPPASSSGGVTVEGFDPLLRNALLVESIKPSAETHLQVAREYGRLGILDAAHARTTRALSLEPRFAAAHEFLARIWRDWGMPAWALVHAHRAVVFAPRSAAARNTLGTVLDALGDSVGARVAYTEALELDANADWALNNLCYLEFRLGRFDEARSHCEAALKVTPFLTAATNNLALTYAASGDMVSAGNTFLGVGDEAAAQYNLGIVHLADRRYSEAAFAFEQAIKIRPAFTAAKKWAHYSRMRVLTQMRHP